MTVVLIMGVGPLPIPLGRKRRWTRRVIMVAAWMYIRMMRLLGLMTFELIHLDALNRPGTLVVANHLTLIDAVFLMSATSKATFIVKSAVSRNPFMSGLVYLAGYIPNSEFGTELIERAVAALRDQETLIVFPEGTRARDLGTFDFKRGAANIALQANCPIQPVFIRCEPIALRKHDKWYDIPSVPSHFQLSALPLIDVNECIDRSQAVGIQARTLTRHLQSQYINQMQKLT